MTIKTIGSGGDYTTLQSWEDAAPANLVTDGNIWQGQIKAASDAFSSASNLLTVSGSTVDATHYKELTTAAGASYRDDASVQTNDLTYGGNAGCTITCTGSNVNAVYINENYSRVSNLQVQLTGTLYTNVAVQINGNTGVFIDSCIIQNSGSTAGSTIRIAVGSPGTVTIRNSLCIQRKTGAAAVARLDGATVVNCTFVTPSDVATKTTNCVGVQYGTTTFKNCAFFGSTNVKAGAGTATYTTSYTDATGTTGLTGGITYDTALFHKTAVAGSFRLVSGSTLLDVGTTDATNAATDIVGTGRPQGSAYDVGCWEYVRPPQRVMRLFAGFKIQFKSGILRIR